MAAVTPDSTGPELLPLPAIGVAIGRRVAPGNR